MEAAAEMGRKVAVVGRRMEQNLEICQQLNYVKVPKVTLVRLDELKMFPDDQVVILTTGSQGEPMSALVQMSKGSYGRMQIKDGDTLVYSARPIPGNEGAIWRTINRLFDAGCTVVYDAPTPIHVSGHAYQEELKMMINLTKPYYIAPVHGEPRHQFVYNNMAREMGYPEHRIFTMRAGIPLVMDETSAHLGEQVPVGQVLVDGSGREGVSDEVLRDRFTVAKEGVVSVTVVIDRDHGAIVGEPMVQARGFHGPDDMEEHAASWIVDALRQLSREELKDAVRVRHTVADSVRRTFQKRAQSRPLVVPTVVEV
jgi:ribonuclease J